MKQSASVSMQPHIQRVDGGSPQALLERQDPLATAITKCVAVNKRMLSCKINSPGLMTGGQQPRGKKTGRGKHRGRQRVGQIVIRRAATFAVVRANRRDSGEND